MGNHDANTRINDNVGPILIASAIAFAGAKIADAVHVGLAELAAECGRES